MIAHLRANLWLLVFSVLLCAVFYPLVLWGIGQTVFHDKAQGSLLADAQGRPIGSRLIAQPFTSAEYFQPRPSATTPAWNAAASGCSNWAASNWQLRDRVARQLGPVVKYQTGTKIGPPVGPDIDIWFQKDRFKRKPGIVAQWAASRSTLAQSWVTADPLHTAYVADWQKTHRAAVDDWIKAHPGTPEPQPADLAAPFFADYVTAHPGTFPGAVKRRSPDGRTVKQIEPVREGEDIQAWFFEMWLQDHPGISLEPVPADAVMASGSGLDPDITCKNALWQLDRVAAAWAKKTGKPERELHDQIEQLLRTKSYSPLAGLVGVPLVNVLEINLALRERYQKPADAGKT